MVAERRPAAAEPEARAAQLVCVLAALVAAAPVAEAKAEGGGPFHQWSASNIAQGSASSSSGAHLDRSKNRTRRDAVNVFKQLRVSAAHAIVQLQATSAAQTTNKIVARSR